MQTQHAHMCTHVYVPTYKCLDVRGLRLLGEILVWRGARFVVMNKHRLDDGVLHALSLGATTIITTTATTWSVQAPSFELNTRVTVLDDHQKDDHCNLVTILCLGCLADEVALRSPTY
jgi:hypothetical protein